MSTRKKESKIIQKINEIYEENELANLESNKNRARSFTVGTAFGGIIEVSMRGDFHNLWCLLQPVEAVEFIEQIAAAAGLQVALRPKQDFASWRGWNVDTENKYWVGSAHWQLGDDDPARRLLNGTQVPEENFSQSQDEDQEEPKEVLKKSKSRKYKVKNEEEIKTKEND